MVSANRVDQDRAPDFAVDEVQKELTTLHGTMMREANCPASSAPSRRAPMILNDPTLAEAPKRIIAEQRCNAEWALVQQMNVLIDQFDQIEDAYLRERKNDVVQVVERVLKRLMGKPGSLPTAVAEERTILVAHDLSPADVIQFKTHHFAAFLTDLGGVTSHTAIVARSLSVPAVVATHNARQMIRDGEMPIVDGSSHVVIVNPTAVVAEYRLEAERVRARAPEARLRGAGRDARRPARRAQHEHRAPATPRRCSTAARTASACSARSSCSSTATACRPKTSSSRRTARSPRGSRASR
jgi:phosphotransferase system enzyme I (PtsI)